MILQGRVTLDMKTPYMVPMDGGWDRPGTTKEFDKGSTGCMQSTGSKRVEQIIEEVV